MKLSKLRRKARKNLVITEELGIDSWYRGYIKLHNGQTVYIDWCYLDELYRFAEYEYIMSYVKYKRIKREIRQIESETDREVLIIVFQALLLAALVAIVLWSTTLIINGLADNSAIKCTWGFILSIVGVLSIVIWSKL